MIIAIDFDGTCVRHEFPLVGADLPHAVRVLRSLAEDHSLILYTMRSGEYLDDAIKWFLDKGIELSGIQYEAKQSSWTTSNKCYAELYIDDLALGAPLIRPKTPGDKPYIDWLAVETMVREMAVVEA